jgi:hypothetical protein
MGATGSQAFRDLQTGLVSVDDVLSYAKTGVGKPKREERSLFVASVALSYAMWENYVEDVAIEATELLQRNINPSAVPSEVRNWIMKSSPTPTAWDIAVYPGWRSLWLAMVTQQAKGDTAETDLGMNTANARNVRRLFERVGVDPFAGSTEARLKNLDRLVKERGQIVHTGKAPKGFYKENATAWRAFVEDIAKEVDEATAQGVDALVSGKPWGY